MLHPFECGFGCGSLLTSDPLSVLELRSRRGPVARKPEAAKQATLNHAPVAFSSFGTGPAEPLVLTADPWSYLRAWLTQKVRKSRTDNKKRLTRALYYSGLAESFYGAATAVPLPAKGTLTYYGVLNLVKAFISVRGVDLESQFEHHGLGLPAGEKESVQVSSKSKDWVSIFQEFATQLGTPVSGKKTYKLTDLCAHIPEIHEITHTLGHLPTTKRTLLPIDIKILFNNNEDKVFSEISYDRKQSQRVRVSRFLSGARENYFADFHVNQNFVSYRSRRRKTFNWDNFPAIYRNLCGDYQRFDICSLLTRDGYHYYCDLGGPSFHHLCYAFMLMFYVGTVTRYRPSEAEALLQGDLRPLISEAIASCPDHEPDHDQCMRRASFEPFKLRAGKTPLVKPDGKEETHPPGPCRSSSKELVTPTSARQRILFPNPPSIPAVFREWQG